MPFVGDFDRERAHEIVTELVRGENPAAVVTKFVVLAEVVDDEDRHTYHYTAPDQRAWDTLGLLRFAEALEQAALIHGEASD